MSAPQARAFTRQAEQFRQLLFHPPEAAPAEGERREIGFQVEARDLGDKPLVVHVPQDFLRNGGRPQVRVHQEHLLLGADAANPALDQAGFEHLLQGAQVVQEGFHEGPLLVFIYDLINVLFAHFQIPDWRSAACPSFSCST
ncbi:MAG TPA: hypothetical protein VF507_04950, partial [Pyrinomonadaceae bacterium]